MDLKKTLKKGMNFIKDPYYRYWVLAGKGIFDSIPDEEYLKRMWRDFFGTELKLDEPKTLCEKLQWLKLYDRRPEYTALVDKAEVKNYVKQKVGEDHVIPTLGIWDSFDEIDYNELPDQFVLKCTHNSGGMVICKDKAKLDKRMAKKRINKELKQNYFFGGREWPYKNVKPRIIAEKYINVLGKPDSIEYKATCFNGKVGFITICTGIAHAEYEQRNNDHFDKNFNKLDWWTYYKPAKDTPRKPKEWDELIVFCEKLAEGIPYARVDTYIVDGKIFFGEITFFTWSGFMKFNPPEWDLKLGEMLDLPEKYSG